MLRAAASFSTRTGEDVHTCGYRPRLVSSRAEESGYSDNLMRARNTTGLPGLNLSIGRTFCLCWKVPREESAKLESGLPWRFQWLRIHLLGTRVCTPVHEEAPLHAAGQLSPCSATAMDPVLQSLEAAATLRL